MSISTPRNGSPTSGAVRILHVLVLSALLLTVDSFIIRPPYVTAPPCSTRGLCRASRCRSGALFGGTGTAKDYAWNEEQYEIELKVTVPPNTKARDVRFVAKAKSVHLTIPLWGEEGGDGEDRRVLLDGERQFRGQIDTDGTFWTISDEEEDEEEDAAADTTDAADDNNNDNNASSSITTPTPTPTTAKKQKNREVTITMEKILTAPQDELEVVDFDWGGIYPNDDDEVLSKTYAEAETLDIREYAKSLGVDIDNINMTMVDKTMFTSGLDGANMTAGMVDELTQKGYAREVTRQDDGTESTDGGMDKGAVPFRPLGDGIHMDELADAAFTTGDERQPLPFIDTPSPWGNDAVASPETHTTAPTVGVEAVTKSKDPIDSLTVVKLKEILRRENLKVGGNKQELQDRLKDHVRAIMVGKRGDNGVLDV